MDKFYAERYLFPFLVSRRDQNILEAGAKEGKKHQRVGLEDCLNLIKRTLVLNHVSQVLKNHVILEMATPQEIWQWLALEGGKQLIL